MAFGGQMQYGIWLHLLEQVDDGRAVADISLDEPVSCVGGDAPERVESIRLTNCTADGAATTRRQGRG